MATAASRRSSGPNRATAVGVGLAIAGLVALVLVSFLWQRDDNPRRTAVARYLEAVDAVERSVGIELQRIDRVYGDLGDLRTSSARRTADMERGERALVDLERRARALQPPPEAEAFHGKLLGLLALQSSLAGDVRFLVQYLPAQAQAQRGIATALVRLQRSLASSRASAAQSAAFGRFERDARRAASMLATVPVPESLEPLRRSEHDRIHRLALLAEGLRTSLANGDAEKLGRLLAELGRLVRQGTTAAERDAVRTYNARIDEIRKRRAALRAALADLDRSLREAP